MTTVNPTQQSLYSRLSPWQSRCVLLLAAAFCAFGLWVSPTPQKMYAESEQATADDMQLYLAEVERMHAGEEYYHVAAQELVARGFPTRSIFNWRTPLSLWIMASLPSAEGGRWILIVASMLLIVLSIKAATREAPQPYRLALPLSLLMTAPLLQCLVGSQFVMPEIWAGLMIALSIATYGLGSWVVSAGFGITALFLRELSLPYCTVCLLFSVWERRRTETILWSLGLSIWALYYAHHCYIVSQLIQSTAVAHEHGWVQFAGLRFLLGTVQVNYFLLILPMPFTVAYLTLSLMGLVDWNSGWGRRISITVFLYAMAFCIVGQDFNRYWGFLTVPLLCFGVARAPMAIYELLIAARLWPISHSAGVASPQQNYVTATAGR